MLKESVLVTKAKSKLAVDPFISAFDVSISIDDSQARVSGVVDNFAQKDHVEMVLTAIDGIEQVQNELAVGTKTTPIVTHEWAIFGTLSAAEANDLEQRLQRIVETRLNLPTGHLKVEVDPHGTVELNGTVGSREERREVEHMLWPVPSVTYVLNRLSVAGDQKTANAGSPLGTLEAGLASTKLKMALLSDDAVRRPFGIKVQVDNRVVSLTGEVDSFAGKDRVLHYAKEFFPNCTIQDQMDVQPDPKLLKETGDVATIADYQEQQQDQGTLEQQPHIVVAPGSWVGTHGLTASATLHPMRHLSDANVHAARQELEGALNTHPDLHDVDIGCTVDSRGSALLTGHVNSAELAREAESLAWEVRGVDYVLNDLRVA